MLFDEIAAAEHRTLKRVWLPHHGGNLRHSVSAGGECDLMSISPKLSNSTPSGNDPRILAQHEESRREPRVIGRLIAECDYQLKFVVGTPADCREVEEYLAAMPQIDRRRVMLMPMGVEMAELEKIAPWLEPYCTAHGLTFCPRKHIEWFGSGRGK